MRKAKLHAADHAALKRARTAFKLTSGFQAVSLHSQDDETLELARELMQQEAQHFEYIEPAADA